MSVDAVILQGAAGQISGLGDSELGRVHLVNGRNYVLLAKGEVHANADLDVTVRLATFLDTATSDEMRLVATHRQPFSEGTTIDGHHIGGEVHDVSATFVLTITVSVPADDDGFFIAVLSGRANVDGRGADYRNVSMIGFPVDSFVTE